MKRIAYPSLAAALLASSPSLAAPPVTGALRPPRPITALPSPGNAELIVMVKGFGRVHTPYGDCLNADEGQSDCNYTVPRDARVVLQAYPATNMPQDWHLAGWAG